MLSSDPHHTKARLASDRKMDVPGSFYDASPFVPDSEDVSVLESAVDNCKGCPLFAQATQGVFGAGPARARLMLVGEQPGDKEDTSGQPFVGPAGQVLDRALVEAGIDRADVYVTNAVKHFKWTPKGGRRIHAKPNRREVQACRPWLEKESSLTQPAVAVCLGTTAALSVFGHDVKLKDVRGKPLNGLWIAPIVVVTIHPSAVLRVPEADRDSLFLSLVSDLRVAETAIRSVKIS